MNLIAAERDAVQAEISALTVQVTGLDTALAALQAIEDRGSTRINVQPADDAEIVNPVAPAVDLPAEPQTSMATIVEAVAKPAIIPPLPAIAPGSAEAFSDLLMADLPRLMTEFPLGPTVKELISEYGAADSRVREACRRLHISNRALFAANQTTGLLHLTPRRAKANAA
ncbi:hypothetical protein QO014_002374 [Kaistia dalseonensis]|uniref:Uncharacterized protein n=1 Tax=Kaistia dalseonensis TaxID=410840 RepID=A0ABU0H7H9_9HYPH|nr:hypothetical protein [Kaistia dalseonensis]MDQ0437982.1 hypothetical protein [Kaistia dalseonensis]